MKLKKEQKTVCMTSQGIDEASETVGIWLENAGVGRRDILRIRMGLEELLLAVSTKNGEVATAEISFAFMQLRIRYGGDRFNPMQHERNELEAVSEEILSRALLTPAWRWRGGCNELRLFVRTKRMRPELVMLLSVAAAVVIGILGNMLPETIQNGMVDYILRFLSDAYLNLLNTFIGVMIFLSIVTGICGFQSVAAFGKVGKTMMTRFVSISFLISGAMVFAMYMLFPLKAGDADGSSMLMSVIKLLFGILPSNPVKPFLEGNTLQIVFMALMVSAALLVAGSEAETLRQGVFQAQKIVMSCVMFACVLLPVYVFSSLVIQFWTNGTEVLLLLWKPVVAVAGLTFVGMAVYFAVTCRKLNVKASVLLPKLLPDYLIGLSTASSSAAFATTMEINEKKLGIDPAFSRTAVPIGTMLFAGISTLLYIGTVVFLADHYGVETDTGWWIILWIVCTLFTMATPPVSGGAISCLSILIVQMGIPKEALAIGATAIVFMDFFATSAHILLLHLEALQQANRRGLLNWEILLRK